MEQFELGLYDSDTVLSNTVYDTLIASQFYKRLPLFSIPFSTTT